MRQKPTVLAREIVATSRLFCVEELKLRFSNGVERTYERLVGKGAGYGAVMIVAMLDAEHAVLVEEYCGGTDEYELSLPKGLIEPGEDVLAAAERELKEEAGYGARQLEHLTELSLSPGYMSQKIQVVLASDLYEERLEGDEPEPMRVDKVNLRDLSSLAQNPQFSEGRALAALYLARDLLTQRGFFPVMSEMSMSFPHPLMAPVVELALRAGEAILPFWRADVAVTAKSDDSPVTAADIAAHHLIVAGLTALDASIPVLSEEDADIPQSVRAGWQRWWLVDPLDGTKEFISGSEEFTVNIALIENGRVVFGVVSMPTNGRFYVGGIGLGAWRGETGGTPVAIQVRDVPAPGEAFTVVASRRHSSPAQERLLAGLSASLGELQLANIGSSLKFCLVAEGAADCYPRLAPTSQWDTAAAQGVLEGAGGEVLDLNGEAFCYPPRESLLNEFFLALPAKAAWRSKLLELARS